jgi:hypothetical protein
MYIDNYLNHIQEMVFDLLLQGRISKKQYPALVYLHWCLVHFYEKQPDSYIRVDFKSCKKSLESFVLVFDKDDGLYFSMEGNSFSEFGHDSYGDEYGLFGRNKEDNWLTTFHQRFDHWFSVVSEILKSKTPFLEVTYHGEFRRDINFISDTFEED